MLNGKPLVKDIFFEKNENIFYNLIEKALLNFDFNSKFGIKINFKEKDENFVDNYNISIQ